MDRTILACLLILNLVIGVTFYIKRNHEVPLFIAIFNLLVEYRIIALQNGNAEWVSFDYGVLFNFNFQQAYAVSELIVLGSSVMLYAFIVFYKTPFTRISDSDTTLANFVQSKKRYIVSGLIIFTLVQMLLPGSVSMGYAFLARLANISFIILIFLVAITSYSRNKGTRLLYIGIFLFLGWLTYGSELRFQFLGWMVPIAVFLSRRMPPSKKLLYGLVGIFSLLIIFSAARVLRARPFGTLSISELYIESKEGLLEADDINFIDGFIMMYQVYPRKLDYTYGMEHINILLRPIPRSLWPGKPLAGWFQNYAAKYKTREVKIGFSPTLYGVFYGEFGTLGVIFLSILWAKLLAYLYSSLKAFKSKLSYLLIGILLACLIPIFRSGDLAGDIAIILMSYWPLIIFARQYKRNTKKPL